MIGRGVKGQSLRPIYPIPIWVCRLMPSGRVPSHLRETESLALGEFLFVTKGFLGMPWGVSPLYARNDYTFIPETITQLADCLCSWSSGS